MPSSIALPRDAKMTDVPCHSWIMPTLLRHAGIEFLHLGCNAASRSPQVPLLFWWEGPDGSRLLTMYAAEGYGTGLMPPENWPYRTWLALIHTGDNHGPPKPEEVSQLLAEAKVKLPGIQVRIGRLSDFADAIVAENAELSRQCVATCPTPGFTARCAIRKAPSWPGTFVLRSGPPSR